jgi:diketogulonate reductase-like aldo/keto reductase
MTNHVVEIAPGVSIPMIGFGTWQIRGDAAYEATRRALEAGYRHIDTATAYGNESQVGRALRDSGVPRKEVFITTKLRPDLVGRERATLDTSLRHLGIDYVDLWLIHWPLNEDPLPEMWQQLLVLRDEGLARAVGVSNYELDQIDALIETSGQAPVINQISWSPSRYDPATLAGNRERGVVVEGYSGLRGANLRDRAITEVASAHDVTPAQVVLRWHLEHDIVIIPKSVHEERIKENLDLYGFDLTPAEVERIDGLSRTGRRH